MGTLELVVRRPGPGEREVLDEGELDLAVGLVGDTWAAAGQQPHRRTAAHTRDMQLNVMSARMVGFLAGDPGAGRWPATSSTSTSTSRTTTCRPVRA